MAERSENEAFGETARDQERFLTLLEPLLDKLSRYALTLTHDREEARDLVSESVALAFENFHTIRVPEAFTGYLFTVLKRLHFRKRKRRAIWEIWRPEHNDVPYDALPGMDARLDYEILEQALQRLPEKQREAVVLFAISQLSLEVIRRIQGGSISGVKSRIARGRKRLARIMGVHPTAAPTAFPSPLPASAPTSLTETHFAFLLRERI
jgi:RNA polymerase sigma-70 factor (ECF subfamily)